MVTARSGLPSASSDFSVSAVVGHASTHAPQDTHSESRNGSCWLADDLRFEAAPFDRQRKRALHLIAGAHAARTDDAGVLVEDEIRIAVVLRRAADALRPAAIGPTPGSA